MSEPSGARRPADVGRTVGTGVRTALIGLDRTRYGRRVETGVAVIAAVVGVVGVLTSMLLTDRGHDAGQPVLLLAGVVLPVALVMQRPLLGWRVGWLVGLLAPFVPREARLDLAGVTVLAVLFTVAAARYGRPVSVGLWLLDVVSAWVWAAGDWRARIYVTVGVTLLAIAVDAVTGRHAARRDLATQTELTRAEYERGAVLEERARIAREMHDVVAHHLSMIAVRTSTAPYRLTDLSAPVRAEFDALNAAACEALADTRALLDTLRTDDAERSPQPTLDDIPALVATAQRAGVQVGLVRRGPTVPVRTVVAVSAYRIVQEALSNATRHAPGATVDVLLDRQPERLVVRVRNTAGARSAGTVAHGGHGLTGMRERVAVLDGHLHAGATSDGGFEVSAELPTGAR